MKVLCPRRFVTVLTLVLLASLAAGSGEVTAREKRVVVQGRVVTADGQGLPEWPVILIATQRYVEFSKFSSGGDVQSLARVTTDENGYFSLDIPKKRGYQYWFVRFTEVGAFDPIRFLPPDDVEITAAVRRGRVAGLEKVVVPHPDWPEVERRIQEAGGPSSPRGNVLRTLGLPEKITRDESGTADEWWYFTKGIVYTFRGGEAVGSRRFEPVEPPPGKGR